MPAPKPGQDPMRFDRGVALCVLGLVLLGCWVVLRPFFSALLWAIVLAYSLWPAFKTLSRWTGGRRTLSAFLMTLGIALVLLLPSSVIVLSLGDNVKEFAVATSNWIDDGPPGPPDWIVKVPVFGKSISAYWLELSQDGGRFAMELKGLIEPVSDGLIKASLLLGRGAVDLVLSVFLGFFFLRHGDKMAASAVAFSERLAGSRGKYLLTKVAGGTVRGVVYGLLGTALIQGLMAGCGFAIAGVPAAILLGLLTFFLSPVPFGPPLVWVPALVWTFQHESTGWSVFMLVWGILISSVDNVVRPIFISQGSNLPFVLVFLGVLGGALAFGLIGVFIGPTLLVVGFRLLDEWARWRGVGTGAKDDAGRAGDSPADT